MAGYQRSSAPTESTVTRGNFEKAKGFLNIYITDKNGNRHQVGGVSLKDSNGLHVKLMENADSLEKINFSMDLNLVQDKSEIELF